MNELSSSQIDIIYEIIEQRGLKHGPLKEELLDHYCCLVEEYMSSTHNFETALKACISDFNSCDLNEIEEMIIKQSKNKYLVMKNLVFITSILLMITTGFLFGQNDNTPVLRPIAEGHKISSGFGEQIHPIKKIKRHHDGLDISAPIGTPIYAPASGIILVALEDESKFGKHIKIKHQEEFQTFFAHLSEINVKKGQNIKKGEIIGKVGNSGLSTGPHLHYEVIKDGKKVDPKNFFTETKKAAL